MDNFNLNRTPIIKFVIPLILGIFCHRLGPAFYAAHFEFLVFLVLYSLFSALLLKEHRTLVGIYWMLFFFLFGGVHTRLSDLSYQQTHFSNYTESDYMILRIDDKVNLANSTRCISTVLYTGSDSLGLTPSSGQLMTYISNPSEIQLTLGQCLLVEYNFYEEKANSNPHVFDYKEYLNNRGIYHRGHFKKEGIILLPNLNYDDLNIKSKRLRNTCINHLREILTNENNLGVAAAMILGERKLLNQELYEAYTDTGAVHVLAVSGLHVGILASFILLLFKLVPSRSRTIKLVQTVVIISTIWAFAFLTGLAAAVTRAALMFTLYFFGKGLMRKADSINILATAAMIMLIYDPNYLFQAGFQFSFLALLGILTFYGPIYRTLLFKRRIFKYLWSGIAVSISAQLLVSPLAIGYFHKLPSYFWLSGIFAVPAAYLILALGLITLSLLLIFKSTNPLIDLIGYFLDHTISLFNTIIFEIQELPFCSADNLWISSTSVFLFYMALLFFTLFVKKKDSRYLYGLLSCLILQSIGHNLENKAAWEKSTLYVYDSYKGTVIDYMSKGRLFQYTTESLDQKSIDYVAKNNRLYNRIQFRLDSTPSDVSKHQNLYKINDQLLLLDPREADMQWATAAPIDLIVLTANYKGNIYQLCRQYCPQLIVLDGTVKERLWTYRKAGENLGIPIHHTSKQGAYTFSI